MRRRANVPFAMSAGAAPYERPVRFEDVDAAKIVFFARVFNYCHEAMEHFFGALDGGYVALINTRHVGFPAVHVQADYLAPLRYGDVVVIAMDVVRIGTTSVTFRYRMSRKDDGVATAVVSHVCVTTNLSTMEKVGMPADVRALLESRLVS